MLLRDDVVGDRQPKPVARASRFRGEVRLEQLVPDLGETPVPLSSKRTSAASPRSQVVIVSIGTNSGPAPLRARLLGSVEAATEQVYDLGH
jgi:hypothetical protein